MILCRVHGDRASAHDWHVSLPFACWSLPPSLARGPRRVINQIPDDILQDPEIHEAVRALPANYNFEIHKTVWRVRQANSKRGELSRHPVSINRKWVLRWSIFHILNISNLCCVVSYIVSYLLPTNALIVRRFECLLNAVNVNVNHVII